MLTKVALNQHFEGFIQDQVDSGRYDSASEVVSAGLRLLESTQTCHAPHLEALRSAVTAGLASGCGQPADKVFDRLEAKYRALNVSMPA